MSDILSKRHNLIDITNLIFDNWTVLELDKEKIGSNNERYWVCKCKCGTIKSVMGGRLRVGKSKSCGCVRVKVNSKIKINDIIGQRYGHLIVIKQGETKLIGEKKRKDVRVTCQCDCGNIKDFSRYYLLKGKVNSCGCYYGRFDEFGNSKKRKIKVLNNHGYMTIYDPTHKRSDRNGYVREHILVMEDYLKRPVEKTEHIHHRNGIKTDNRIENLELWSKHHPFGQRVEDLVKYANDIISKYRDYINPTAMNYQI